MNKYLLCCKENGIEVTGIEYRDGYTIVTSFDKQYLLKKYNPRTSMVRSSLMELGEDSFLSLITNWNGYELYQYYNNNHNVDIKREFIKSVFNIHKKSLNICQMDSSSKNDLYKGLVLKIDNLFKYYLDLQDYIEEMDIIPPDYYLLLINISKFYKVLRFARIELDEWYNKNDLEFRKCLLVGNVSLSNYIFHDRGYFVILDSFKNDMLFLDLVNLYKTYDKYSNEIYDLYYDNGLLGSNDKTLFFVMISLLRKISFSDSSYININDVREEIDYIDRLLLFISEKYEEDEKTD